MKRKHSKGFTLIELVVAIAIILIIAFIILMSLTKSRARARDQERIADLNTIAQAMTQYNAQNRNYPYWEMIKSKRGIFNYAINDECSETYPCIYDATSGSSWRNFIDNYLTSRPIAPKSGSEMQYFYNATSSESTPPTHYAVGAQLESDNYTATKFSTDPWYTTGYCQASDCLPEFPVSGSGWLYVVGG